VFDGMTMRTCLELSSFACLPAPSFSASDTKPTVKQERTSAKFYLRPLNFIQGGHLNPHQLNISPPSLLQLRKTTCSRITHRTIVFVTALKIESRAFLPTSDCAPPDFWPPFVTTFDALAHNSRTKFHLPFHLRFMAYDI
jgi:hypothetical protein